MLSTHLIAALGGATVAIATPALADPREAPPAPVATSAVVAPAVSATQRYCIVDTPTGSHIQKRTCMTRARWLEQGVDPLATRK